MQFNFLGKGIRPKIGFSQSLKTAKITKDLRKKYTTEQSLKPSYGGSSANRQQSTKSTPHEKQSQRCLNRSLQGGISTPNNATLHVGVCLYTQKPATVVCFIHDRLPNRWNYFHKVNAIGTAEQSKLQNCVLKNLKNNHLISRNSAVN